MNDKLGFVGDSGNQVLEEELKLAILREATLLEQDVLKRNRKEYKKKYGEKRRRKQSQY